MEYEEFYEIMNVRNPELEEHGWKEMDEVLRDDYTRDLYKILNHEDLTKEEARKYAEAFQLAQLSGTSLERISSLEKITGEATKAFAFITIGVSLMAVYHLEILSPNNIREARKDLDGNGVKELILENNDGKKTPFYGIEEDGQIKYITADKIRKKHTSDIQTKEFYQKLEAELNKEVK